MNTNIAAAAVKDLETQNLIGGHGHLSIAKTVDYGGGFIGWWSWLVADSHASQEEAKRAKLTRWTLGGVALAIVLIAVGIVSR